METSLEMMTSGVLLLGSSYQWPWPGIIHGPLV